MDIPNIDKHESSFNARFKKHKLEYTSENNRQKGYFFYLPFRDGEVTTNEFLNYLIAETIHYAISYDKREKFCDNLTPENMSEYMSLRKEIKSLFTHTSRSGDFGELIIYLILRDFFNAPQIVNKLKLKTAGNVPYHGADGLHIKFEGDNLLLFFAESKLEAVDKTDNQIQKACDSTKSIISNEQVPNQTIGKRDFEINLINNHFELPNITELQKEKILNYLNPLKQESNDCKYASACLIGFNFKFYTEIKEKNNIEEIFLENYQKIIDSFIRSIKSNVSNCGIQDKNLIFILLPFESIIDFRKRFLELL